MNKLKNLFSKPLISSNAKITPSANNTSYQQETTKPEEFVTSQQNARSPGRLLKKSHSFFPMPSPDRKKKHSLPPVKRESNQSQEMAGFDFEQFEDIVDKKKLRQSRDKLDRLASNDEKENKSTRARRHSWSTSDQAISQHGIGILKKFQFPPINTNLPTNTNGVASPTVRSPLNQSRDEYAGLLDMGESNRKEYCISPIEPCDEEPRKRERRKSSIDSAELRTRERRRSSIDSGISGEYRSKEKRKSSVISRRKSERKSSITPQRGDHEQIETDGYIPEKRISNKEVKSEIFGPIEQTTSEVFDGEVGQEDSNNQRDLFRKLSARLALTNQFGNANGNSKPTEKAHSLSDMGSSDSNLDSLVEENPFEDEITIRAKTSTLKRQKTKLRDDKKYSHIRWILFPDDTLKKVLDITIAIALLYTALVMPVRVTFIQEDDGEYLWTTLDWIVDGMFFLDIISTFFSAYFDAEENLVLQKRKIAMHYLTGWFVPDVVSVAPFHLFSDTSDQSQRLNNLVRVARLPRLYKLVKIVKLVRMIKIIKDRDKFKNYMNGILKLNAAYERLAVGVVGIFLFCHISACLWFTLVDLGDSDLDWLSVNDLDFIPKFDQYIASFYFVVQTVITVGYGELSPKTKEERLLACFLMIIGVLFYSLFIGFVSSLINDMDIMNQRFNNKLAVLHRLQKDYALPLFFVKKLKKAIQYESKQTIDSKLFVDYLPKNLSIELFCVMHKDVIDSIAFLQNRPKAFIAALCPLLKPISINKKDTIFTEGDPADEIFFIKSGTVGYVIPKFKNECFLKVREGYFFGETDLLFYGEIRKYTAIALKDCELYVLNKKDFKQVFLTTFREIGGALFENAYKRKQRTRKAYKEALEICKNRQDDHHHKHKHKLRLNMATKKGFNQSDSEDSDDSALPNALMGIVEEEEEEEEEIMQPPQPEEVEDLTQAKGLGGLSRLKAALALKRAFAPKSQKNLLQSVVLSKDNVKEDSKLGDLHKKIDGLESKLAKLITIGHALKSQSSKDLNSPGAHNQSLALSRIVQTPSNRSKIPGSQTDQPSPTGSDSPLGSFRSPNAMRRTAGLKKSENPAFKMFSSVKQFGLAASSAMGQDSERDRLNTPTARSTYRDTNGDVTTKTVANSEQDRLVITDHNFEMKGEKDSSEEEKDKEIEKLKKEEEERMKPVYKLLFKMGDKKKPKDESLNLKISVSQPDGKSDTSQISKNRSNLDVEDF